MPCSKRPPTPMIKRNPRKVFIGWNPEKVRKDYDTNGITRRPRR